MSLINELRGENGKPLRRRAEIMIWRDGKILVTHNRHGTHRWYGLPGGGIDHGETPRDAAVREALEEVGIAVRNVVNTGEVFIGKNPPGLYGPRARMYGGVHTTLFKGDYDRVDHSIYGSEGDPAPFIWLTPKEAYKIFLDLYNDNNDRGRHRVSELEKYV